MRIPLAQCVVQGGRHPVLVDIGPSLGLHWPGYGASTSGEGGAGQCHSYQHVPRPSQKAQLGLGNLDFRSCELRLG